MNFQLANTLGADPEKALEKGELSQLRRPAPHTRWIVSRSIRKKALPNGKALNGYSRVMRVTAAAKGWPASPVNR
jgi:hypothetical protein